MKQNILFFTALKANDPNMMAYQEWSLKTWQYYADKYGHRLIVLKDAVYDTEWMRPTWQRWYVGFDQCETCSCCRAGVLWLQPIVTIHGPNQSFVGSHSQTPPFGAWPWRFDP